MMLFLAPTIVMLLIKDIIQGTRMESALIDLLQNPNGKMIIVGVALAVSILVLAVSYVISVRIYSSKEF